jgi:hypothetical protein
MYGRGATGVPTAPASKSAEAEGPAAVPVVALGVVSSS